MLHNVALKCPPPPQGPYQSYQPYQNYQPGGLTVRPQEEQQRRGSYLRMDSHAIDVCTQ